MRNILEGMKAVWSNEVFEIKKIDYIEGYGGKGCVHLARENGNDINLMLADIKPLPKFPDKDSEGSECWSGDLLMWSDQIISIHHNGFSWFWDFIIAGDVTKDPVSIVNEEESQDCMLGAIRFCSIYDKEALDYLDQETIDKLKEMGKEMSCNSEDIKKGQRERADRERLKDEPYVIRLREGNIALKAEVGELGGEVRGLQKELEQQAVGLLLSKSELRLSKSLVSLKQAQLQKDIEFIKGVINMDCTNPVRTIVDAEQILKEIESLTKKEDQNDRT